MLDDKMKKVIKERYASFAKNKESCSCDNGPKNKDIAKSIGYSDKDMDLLAGANLGLGCGNPIALGKIRPGETVLDLGSGAGFDCFLAAKKVGADGKVIGIDMTETMIKKARDNALQYGYGNVEFKLGDIENLPIENNTIDVIISNCVINLASDKAKVFAEAFRVLKNNGRIYISDLVLLKALTKEQRGDGGLVAGCVGEALLKEDYLNIIKEAGFEVNILSEDKEIGKRQYNDMPFESLKIEARKKEA